MSTVKSREERERMAYSDWIETETREECDREAISKKLKKGRTPEWIHKEDGYPMELILEVQAIGESKNRAHKEPQGLDPVVDCADVDTTSLYGKLVALEAHKKAYENFVRDVYDCERIAAKLRKGRSPEWIHEEDEYPMELILEVQSMLEDEKHDAERV